MLSYLKLYNHHSRLSIFQIPLHDQFVYTIFQPLSCRCNVASLLLIFHYFHGNFSDKLHPLVPPVGSFTDKTPSFVYGVEAITVLPYFKNRSFWNRLLCACFLELRINHILIIFNSYNYIQITHLSCAWTLYLFYPGVISFTQAHCINFRNYSVLFLLIINGFVITFYRISFRYAEPGVTSFEENTLKKQLIIETIKHVKKYFIRIRLIINYRESQILLVLILQSSFYYMQLRMA